MDMVIIEVSSNDRYGNNSACLDISIQDTVINTMIEVSDLSILATCYTNLLNRYIDILIFQEHVLEK